MPERRSPLMKPFVVLALPGMYLFYKYNQYKRKRKENATKRLAERELQHLNSKISADIVLILPSESLKPDTPIGERIMKEGKRLYNIATQCSIYAPRAVLVVNVPPVSVTTALVTEVLRKTNFYHPGRIVGSAAIAQVKANTLLARYQDLDPQNCYVPLVGGPDNDLALPLFSRSKPVEIFGSKGVKTLTARFRGVPEDDFPKNQGDCNFVDDCPLAESFALNQLISTIALGICGDKKALANVFVRNNLLETCKYLVSTVQFSRGGIVHNHGLPPLSSFELDLVERACLQIKERESMAEDYVQFVEDKDHPKPPTFTEKVKLEQEILKQTVIR
ncbi:unnamed protein product [Ceutorhynchus assimilis]|uniref:Uncharacterized protein n=1 Tax=Ceutorhynchus assimilis TaxID=467358 RepID=A0A9P0GR20_9CUCU|nr:unnamed protein product [Ceutorhynchus assimilis]